jgi:hypothetical protein
MQLIEMDVLFVDRGVDPHRDRDQPEGDVRRFQFSSHGA